MTFPACEKLVAQTAEPLCSAMAEQFAIGAAPLVKLTVPVADDGVTVAVRVTLWPVDAVEGAAETVTPAAAFPTTN